jgi:cell wall-associated NlpC family hydrolase
MAGESSENSAEDAVKKGASLAWLFPGCSCLFIILFIIICIGAFASTYSKSIGDQTPNGGSGSCGTTDSITLSGHTYKMRATSGPISEEDHLVSTGDSNQHPGDIHSGISEHLSVTNFSTNCPSGSSNCSPSSQVWTPAEGGGSVGGGSGHGVPPASAEPWGMNELWGGSIGTCSSETPPAGTKVIITSTKTGKSVVAAAGYECGPGSTSFAAGAQNEVLANLGINSGDSVTLGFAIDQSVPYGPYTCKGGGGTITGCGQSIISDAAQYQGIPYGHDNHCGSSSTTGPNGVRNLDCSGFASRVYRDAGLAPKGWCIDTAELRADDSDVSSVLQQISSSQIQPGDLVSSGSGDSDGHVVIYVSGDVTSSFTIWEEGGDQDNVHTTTRSARSNQQYWHAKACK